MLVITSGVLGKFQSYDWSSLSAKPTWAMALIDLILPIISLETLIYFEKS
jgi:hypothetical protein